MPLLDHFKPPVNRRVKFDSLTAFWAVGLAKWLNRSLPADQFQAFAETKLGAQVEADVAEYGLEPAVSKAGPTEFTPTAEPALATVEAVYPDTYEVTVRERFGDLALVGVIELVSPGNKKSRLMQEAFVAKCVAYLRQGVGLVIVDVVTERRVNFHNRLMDAVGGPAALRLADRSAAYVSGYRPVRRRGRNKIDLWPYPAVVGSALPAAPLCLRGGPQVTLDLEGIYTEALADGGYRGSAAT